MGRRSLFSFIFILVLFGNRANAVCSSTGPIEVMRGIEYSRYLCRTSAQSDCSNIHNYQRDIQIGSMTSPNNLELICVATPCNPAYQANVAYRTKVYVPDGCSIADANQRENIEVRPVCGSIIRPESQVVGERIPIVGLPFELTYFTNRIRGRKADYKAKFYLNGFSDNVTITNVPGQPVFNYQSTLVEVRDEAGIVVATNLYNSLPLPESYSFEWANPTGLGAKKFTFYRKPNYVSNSQNYSYGFQSGFYLGSFRSETLGLGGWFPSNWHYYDIVSKELFSPDGNRIAVTPAVLSNGEYRISAADGSEVYEFDSSGRHLRTKSFLLGSVLYSFEYTSSGKLYRMVERNGRATVFNRDSNEKWVSITSASGKTSLVTLTADGYLAQLSDPQNKSFVMTYHGSEGLLSTFTKPTLEMNTFTYDTDGNLIKDEHSGGTWSTLVDLTTESTPRSKSISSREGKTTYYNSKFANENSYTFSTVHNGLGYTDTYSKDGNSESWNRRGVTTTKGTSYDLGRFPKQFRQTDGSNEMSSGNNRLFTYYNFTTPANPIEPWTYTSLLNQAILQKNAGGTSVTQSTFTKSSRTWSVSSSMGNTYSTVLDTFERPISYTKGTLNPITFTYEMDQLKTIQNTNNRITTFNYDSTTRLMTSIVNPLNQTTSFGYDSNERLSSVVLPDLNVITYTYDNSGRVVGVTPPSRPIHTFGLDSKELLGTYTAPTQLTSLQISYNNDRQPILVTRPSGRTIGYNYHSIAGDLSSIVTSSGTTSIARNSPYRRVATVTSPSSIITGYEYSGDYVSKESVTNGAITAYTKKYYAAEGKTSAIDMKIGSAAVSTINYAYNNDEQLTQAGSIGVYYSAAPNGILNKTTLGVLDENITTNNFAEVTAREVKNGNDILYYDSMTRDNLGRVDTRLYGFYGSQAVGNIFIYDNRGRLKEVQDLLSNWIRKYDYDANGNRTSLQVASPASTTTFVYDSQDRLTSRGAITYTYNTDGELETKTNTVLNQTASYVYDTLGNLTQVTLENGSIITYEIDGLNRRVTKKVNGTATLRYLWEGSRLVAELNSDGSLKRRYVYATKSHAPDYYVEAGVDYKIVTDTLGSPMMVIKASDGTIIQQIEYDEFGNVLMDTRSGELAIGFAGGLSDWDTKLVRFGARDYDPMVGRWTAKDPILFAGGQSNLYGYVMNDPINFIDPSGLKPGDIYPSQEEAGIQAIKDINPTSIKQNHEYFGFVFKKDNGYSYTSPSKTPSSDGGTISCPSGVKPDAMYHTHGGPGKPDFEFFSKQDMDTAVSSGLNSYLGTPSGAIKVFLVDGQIGMKLLVPGKK